MFNDAIVYDRYGPPAAVLTLKRLPLACRWRADGCGSGCALPR